MKSKESEPVALKAGDRTVLINGVPVQVDFRVISESKYQELLNRVKELEEQLANQKEIHNPKAC